MPTELNELQNFSPVEIDNLSDDDIARMAMELEEKKSTLRKENQLLFYEPVSDEARRFHLSKALQRIVVGGNGSSKSESQIVDLLIEMTGIIPFSLEADYPKEKLRPPIHARIVVASLTATWEQTIKPKLQWDKWTGLADHVHGHWGWIPKDLLKKGKWDESWSEKYHILTLTNGSTCHIMSHDQDIESAASASLHRIAIDEGPKHSLWRESLMRLREGGYISLAMTPPDEEAASWDAAWVFDELYEKGLDGATKDPDIDSFTFFTEDNPHISQETMAKMARSLTPAQREVRFHGRFLHLSGRIYPTYSDKEAWWCFACHQNCFVDKGRCITCGAEDVVLYCHFVSMPPAVSSWPCIMVLDPHPRKANCLAWYAIDPSDDIWQVAELQNNDEPLVLKDRVYDLETSLGLNVVRRLMDPNMGRNPASSNKHHLGVTIQEDFGTVGLRCDLADDNQVVARQRLTSYLNPDPMTRVPRFRIVNTCRVSNYQFQHYLWDEWTRYTGDQRDPKPRPREKDDDFPTCAQYLVNSEPRFRSLRAYGEPFRYMDKGEQPRYY